MRTSEPKWLESVAGAYKDKIPIQIVDDANSGIDPSKDTILAMGRKVSLGANEWLAVIVSIGVGATGAVLLAIAALDPEPFSKIGLTIGAGTVLTLGGGGMAVLTLTRRKPPNVKIIAGTPPEFEISWD